MLYTWELDWSSSEGDYITMQSDQKECAAACVNDPRCWSDDPRCCSNRACRCAEYVGRTENVTPMHGIEVIRDAAGDGRTAVVPCTWYAAARDLAPGEELLVDYGPTFFEDMEVAVRVQNHYLALVRAKNAYLVLAMLFAFMWVCTLLFHLLRC